MKNIFLFFIAIALCNCKPSKDTPAASIKTEPTTVAPSSATVEPATTTVQETKDASTTQSDADTTMRFIVSFYSIGSGIEGTLATKLKAFADDYQKAGNKKIIYSQVHWGEEGEKDFCFRLKELNTAQQLDFISKVKEILQSAKHVHFLENRACRKVK